MWAASHETFARHKIRWHSERGCYPVPSGSVHSSPRRASNARVARARAFIKTIGRIPTSQASDLAMTRNFEDDTNGNK
jgi:hypothetical protein